jgi:hypothetical protein
MWNCGRGICGRYVRLGGMYEVKEEKVEKECTGRSECKMCWKNEKWKECMRARMRRMRQVLEERCGRNEWRVGGML